MTAPRRRWPLLVIGGSAGTATWSGWVGLGTLTGFGLVHPLPGIADDLSLNTAVTLPVGVEAYALYALSIATTPRPLAPRTRRYAWASAAGALALGMAGQVAYHLLTAAGVTTAGSAPWPVVAVVSCLPVLVLGAASLLWHLAGADISTDPSAHNDGLPVLHNVLNGVPAAAATRAAVHTPTAIDQAGQAGQAGQVGQVGQVDVVDAFEAAPVLPVPGLGDSDLDPHAGRGRIAATPNDARQRGQLGPFGLSRGGTNAASQSSSARLARSVGAVLAREDDVRRLRAAVAAGVLPPRPSTEQVRAHLAIGRDFARAARDAVRGAPAEPMAPLTGQATDSDDQQKHSASAEQPQETSTTAEEPVRAPVPSPAHKSDPEIYQPPQQYQHHDQHLAIPQQLPEQQSTDSKDTHTYATPLP